MSLIAALEKWTDGRMVSLKESYRKHGLKASGNWERELESEVKQSGNSISISISGSHYTEQLVRGRGKTKKAGTGQTLQQAIRQWIDDKGITPVRGDKDGLSWAISKKIHREGIKVPNRFNSGTFIDEVFYTADGTLTEFQKILADNYAKTIKQEITQGL